MGRNIPNPGAPSPFENRIPNHILELSQIPADVSSALVVLITAFLRPCWLHIQWAGSTSTIDEPLSLLPPSPASLALAETNHALCLDKLAIGGQSTSCGLLGSRIRLPAKARIVLTIRSTAHSLECNNPSSRPLTVDPATAEDKED